MIGHPNVGKSSLINSIFGKVVVSTSRTPGLIFTKLYIYICILYIITSKSINFIGHTNHFQTIHLSKNIRLCDSPGLVFPSLLLKQLQVFYIFLKKLIIYN